MDRIRYRGKHVLEGLRPGHSSICHRGEERETRVFRRAGVAARVLIAFRLSNSSHKITR